MRRQATLTKLVNQQRILERLNEDLDAFKEITEKLDKNKKIVDALRKKRKFGLTPPERIDLMAARQEFTPLKALQNQLNIDLQKSIKRALDNNLLKDLPDVVLNDIQIFLDAQKGFKGEIDFAEAAKRLKKTRALKNIKNPVTRFFKNVALAGGGEVPDIGFSAFYDDPMVGSVQFIPIPISTPSKTSESNSLIAMSGMGRIRQTQSSLYAGGLS